MRLINISLILAMTLGSWALKAENEQIDSGVLSRIEDMGEYLQSLKSFNVQSNSTFDVVMKNDQKVEIDATVTYKIQRPNKLFAEIKSAQKHRQYFFNGKELTVYSPDLKFYGSIDTLPTITGLIDKAHDEYGLEMPLLDIFDWGSPRNKNKEITSAKFIQEIKRDRKTIDHFAIRQGKVDWQIWIPRGQRPLPEKIIYVRNDDQARPQMTSILNWDIKTAVKSKVFTFKPPKDAYKIELKPALQKDIAE